jgi:flagellar assembly protein FliH
MTAATKFTFNSDFRSPGRRIDEAALEAAKAEAFKAGQEQGRREAQSELAGLTALFARAAEQLLAQEDQRRAAIEEQAARLAIAAGQALAGAALEARPLAALEAAVRECLSHARSAPHLVLRVHDGSIEAVEGLAKRLAGEVGFPGRLVVLGDPEIAPGDGRIEWADGGFAFEAQRLEEMINARAAALFGGTP